MKEIIMIILMILSLFGLAEHNSKHLYPLTTTVISVNYETDIVTVKDCNGNLWDFAGAEDWLPGDTCSMIMHDNNTPEIFDDIIKDTKYSSFIVEK